MFAIQPINKFYNTKKYLAINSETNIPYIIYEGGPNYPEGIKGFETPKDAVDYLTKFINREGIDVMSLTISQMVDISLVNNANQFDIVEYEIQEGKMKVIATHTQTQFNRDAWYKG